MPKAVALRYDETLPAPIIVGRARGPAAERAIKRAQELGVPLVRDPILAEALLPFDVGQLVPTDYWELVAKVFIAIRNVGK
jgi:type III secretion system FlhB-like substrate exporter